MSDNEQQHQFHPAIPEQRRPEPEPPVSRSTRPALRTVVGATAAVLVVGGASFAVGASVADAKSPDAAGTSSGVRTQDQQMPRPGSGPLYGGGQGSSGSGASGSTTTTTTTATASQLVGLVRIQTELGYADGEAAGTGMILTSDGEVVTNHHVVEGATKIEATDMTTGKTYTARVVGTDADADVAVLQLQDASGLDTIKADTDGVSTGDAVTAVGDAQGAEQLSSATGTVAALDQSITTQSEGATEGERLRGLIEVDADVISGDSGGATYDGQGEVVGMTTAASSGSANVTGYAIPISTVLSIAGDLTSGVSGTDYVYGYPAFLGIALGQEGTTVQGVYDGTPAAEAGLGAGDTITAVDGASVSTAQQLTKALTAHQPGDTVHLSWTDAGGATDGADVTLTQGPVA